MSTAMRTLPVAAHLQTPSTSRTQAKVVAFAAKPQRMGAVRVSAPKAGARKAVVMMSAATDEIIEKLKTLTLLEAAELVKQIETVFGVDASAPVGGAVMMAAPGAGAGAAAAAEEEQQTEFKLIITDCDAAKRIGAIKVVRSLTSLGLKEAKDAVTALPFTILEAKPKAEVEKAKKELEEAGCKCEIK